MGCGILVHGLEDGRFLLQAFEMAVVELFQSSVDLRESVLQLVLVL